MYEQSDSESSNSTSLDGSPQSESSSSSESETKKHKKKKPGTKKTPLKEIKEALQNLVNEEENPENSSNTKKDFFCVEDTFLSKDLQVTVENIGLLSFPLDKKSIQEIIKLSTKAKFGKGKDTLLDTDVRDTHMIPSNKLTVEINKKIFSELLDRISIGLNIDNNNHLEPHLHNMLIYAPGQFFKMHTDSEKIENMIATLVIILPSKHKGGELVIMQDNKKHMFFGSANPDIVKCVAFYADCKHEIKKVTEGYRVALTYNVVLNSDCTNLLSSCAFEVSNTNKSLESALLNYFADEEVKKLVYGLNHSYTEHNLKWNLLKGVDRTRVNALFAVAKKQGRIPCLALSTYHEVYDKENTYYCPSEDPALVVEETELYFWVDENNMKYKNNCGYGDNNDVKKKEFCCNKKTRDLFKPYETDASGPTGNEGDTEEYWYRRACIVLWSNNWVFLHGYRQGLAELHHLTTEVGMETILLKKINKIKKDFIQPKFWVENEMVEQILDLVIYVNDRDTARLILSEMSKQLLNKDHIKHLLKLEQQFGEKFWCGVVEHWKNQKFYGHWHKIVYDGDDFIDAYVNCRGKLFKSVIIDALLEEKVLNITKSENTNCSYNEIKYVYGRTSDKTLNKLVKLFTTCMDLHKVNLVEQLIDHVLLTPSLYPPVSLGELYCKLDSFYKTSPDKSSNTGEIPEVFRKLRESAAIAMNLQLSQLVNEVDWSFPMKNKCECKNCAPIVSFFNSKTSVTYGISVTRNVKSHIETKFYSFSFDPYKLSVRKDGKRFQINIEKLPKLMEDRNNLKADLTMCMQKCAINNKPFEIIEVENAIKAEPEDFDAIDEKFTNNSSVKLENQTYVPSCSYVMETVKMEPELTIMDINEESSVDIETEPKIPAKRQRKHQGKKK